MSIVSSSHVVGHAQRDGRRYVTETHVDSEGSTHTFEYLAAQNADYAAVRDARATTLADWLAQQEIDEVLGD